MGSKASIHTLQPENIQSMQAIRQAVLTAACHLPWHPICLPQALAAKWMLKRRNIKSILYLGIKNTHDPHTHSDLHAWLGVGEQMIIGGEIADQYEILATFDTK